VRGLGAVQGGHGAIGATGFTEFCEFRIGSTVSVIVSFRAFSELSNRFPLGLPPDRFAGVAQHWNSETVRKNNIKEIPDF